MLNRFRLATLIALFSISAALRAQEAPRADSFSIARDFKIERILSVDRETNGSWVSMTVDQKGRFITCDQRGKLHRVTLSAGAAELEQLKVDVGHAQGLLYAFDSLYVMGKQEELSGLFRLEDTTGDDEFDKIEHFRKLPVGGEHDAHGIILGPDKKSICVGCGNRSRFPAPGFDRSRVPQIWKGDHLLTRMPDARGHNTGAHPIGGWIARLDPDGTNMELIANGFRNEYDIAFNTGGPCATVVSRDQAWRSPSAASGAVMTSMNQLTTDASWP